mmetsp:Transcript_41026/g.80236  ORF Transcript_41026/g.80236 Transcript_41026/m.80236 type:complete len:261 (-) Transcript_41026:390-1172(-)
MYALANAPSSASACGAMASSAYTKSANSVAAPRPRVVGVQSDRSVSSDGSIPSRCDRTSCLAPLHGRAPEKAAGYILEILGGAGSSSAAAPASPGAWDRPTLSTSSTQVERTVSRSSLTPWRSTGRSLGTAALGMVCSHDATTCSTASRTWCARSRLSLAMKGIISSKTLGSPQGTSAPRPCRAATRVRYCWCARLAASALHTAGTNSADSAFATSLRSIARSAATFLASGNLSKQLFSHTEQRSATHSLAEAGESVMSW